METLQKVSHIGCDLHKKFTLATARDAQNRLLWRQRLEHADRPRLQAQLSTWPKGTPVIFEASFGWGWFADAVQAAELEPHLASSRKVAAWREARGLAKSNRVDADLLSELWSQQPRWWEVWLAPPVGQGRPGGPAVREQREWLRYRMALVRIQTGLKNRIHAVLHRHGLVHEFADLFGRDGRRFLSLLAGPRDVTLPDSARATLKGQLPRRAGAGPGAAADRPGDARVSPHGAAGPGGRAVAAAAGDRLRVGLHAGRGDRADRAFSQLQALGVVQSAGPAGLRLGRAGGRAAAGAASRRAGTGRRTLKWALIEAARGAVRHGGRFRQLYDRRTDGGQRNRNRGYIAVARELARLVDIVWRKGVAYTEAPPPRPGSRWRSKRSRPGTGQPVDAMVGVAE